ncbi:ankyrin repeat, SAM and basic leucine zipper domain-containing protein 1 isoform X2 [Lepisosteus oculatus]|uniref:ankyrin repeat, SAM and basic leucine zipper domain-containing protein 1 isoform X2 n=1 Tax=Lepisosteus oculatus TaxID=7918 RepID=UPI0007400BF4|nr:PREDICTED: ankyrin repeat, SAM and basic leucine zipper domain-containing protein 1 isoform X2 [Lepisosteus oculatus]
MHQEVENAYPAGDESSESDEEWELGYSRKPNSESSNTSVPEDDKIYTFKKALSSGDVQMVKQLLDSGVDVECPLGFQWTPLMCAVHTANYELAQVLLDRGANANFSKDQYTVLMSACIASAPEEQIVKCVELLLSRNADPNAFNKYHMTPLMFSARDGHTQVIALLISYGAEINTKDVNGYTALTLAAQYGREGAALKLLELGADITVKTREGYTAADIAKMYRHSQISRILASPHNLPGSREHLSKEETLFKFFKGNPDPITPSRESSSKLGDIELLLHGLDLEYLTDIMLDNDISWSHLLTMEKEDLEKIGVRDPADQKKVLTAVQEMQLDKIEIDKFAGLENFDSSEELYNFLISLQQQCMYLTETVQDVINRVPRHVSTRVLSWDPKRESQSLCDKLVAQTMDLHKEMICLHNLLDKMNQAEDPCRLPLPGACVSWRTKTLKRVLAALFGVGLLFCYTVAKKT